ncbi:SRPBCC family protein [Ktedonospora formicarum]|uniref:Coenzyme Q-binding protein COQ10 START domain-containing protein n=1 Tax=Ktedonospora formicarum TaxID=2778364 RepID=A0A8J3HW45_9CHLR|nr:SRPBCC family protein [Ktedonospora formicarum]GHO44849.1 hypothetical protein KSX_30120 [Ktedonospora formicarum]
MAEHHVSVTIQAPVEQVYTLFTHFNDFPKFMRFIKEVTYYDEQRSHWVAEVGGSAYEWDALNEDWITDKQVGWRSVEGLENSGRVKFEPVGPERTMVNVFISYTPPAGILGAVAERLGIDSRFQAALEEDMQHFARMVEEAPPRALDPMSSHYLFHAGSAVGRGAATTRQQEAMQQDPRMSEESLRQREATIAQEKEALESQERSRVEQDRQYQEQLEIARTEQEALLEEQRRRDEVESAQKKGGEASPRILDPVYDTIGGRNAAMANTAFGDMDARGERFPNYHTSPMRARAINTEERGTQMPVEKDEESSPWESQIHGRPFPTEEEERLSPEGK